MRCPYCGEVNQSRVIDTGPDQRGGIRRRRECEVCGRRFSTTERAIVHTPLLIKGNGEREEFDREKLLRGVRIATAKRPISAGEIDKIVDHVEQDLQQMGRAEVSSRVVGDLVIEGLKNLDLIAYLRYAIVYLGLDNLESVKKEIDHLLTEGQPSRKNQGNKTT
jgi:transcriptional repressor NrdR